MWHKIKDCLWNTKRTGSMSIFPRARKQKHPWAQPPHNWRDIHVGHLGRMGEALQSTSLVGITSFWHTPNQGQATTATEVGRCLRLLSSSHCTLAIGLCCWHSFTSRIEMQLFSSFLKKSLPRKRGLIQTFLVYLSGNAPITPIN